MKGGCKRGKMRPNEGRTCVNESNARRWILAPFYPILLFAVNFAEGKDSNSCAMPSANWN